MEKSIEKSLIKSVEKNNLDEKTKENNDFKISHKSEKEEYKIEEDNYNSLTFKSIFYEKPKKLPLKFYNNKSLFNSI